LLETRDFLYVQGDATEDEVLMRAGIDRARGLIASLSTDQDNLFVVLSAKQLNRSLRVTSKAVEESSRAKLTKAGADDVVLADQIGGVRLVSTVIRPIVVDFLDVMLKDHVTTRFAESIIQSQSPFIGLTLSEAGIPDETELVVVAVRNRAGDIIYNPSGELRLDEGDALIVIADNAQLTNLNKSTRDTL
jgi:voltage-gated potassium channel